LNQISSVDNSPSSFNFQLLLSWLKWLKHWAFIEGVLSKCQEVTLILSAQHKLGSLLFEKSGTWVWSDFTKVLLLLHKASFEISIGTDAVCEVFDCWRFSLRITINHRSDSKFFVVRVAHLGWWSMSIEVHYRTNRHIALVAIELKRFVSLNWCIVCEEVLLLFSGQLFEGNSESISKWSILEEESVVFPEYI